MDLLLNTSFDLDVNGGDLVTGESTRQHQQLLLLIEKGELREFPLRGVGLQTWLLDDQAGNLNATIKREFETDGMTVRQISGSATNGTLKTDAYYP